jgi:hypothetical protein
MANKRKAIKAASKTAGKVIKLDPVPVTITAASGEGAGPARFDVLAYTGDPVKIDAYDDPVVIDLAGVTFRKTLIATLDHDRTKRVGHVTEREIADGQLTMGGVASAATPARDEVVASAKDGFTWQASVEAMPSELDKLGAGKTANVNGREITGPAIIARRSTMRGFAFVTHGADDATSVTIAAGAAGSGGKTMDEDLRKFIEATLPGTDPDSLSEEALANMQATMEGRDPEPPRKRKKAGKMDSIVAIPIASN